MNGILISCEPVNDNFTRTMEGRIVRSVGVDVFPNIMFVFNYNLFIHRHSIQHCYFKILNFSVHVSSYCPLKGQQLNFKLDTMQ